MNNLKIDIDTFSILLLSFKVFAEINNKTYINVYDVTYLFKSLIVEDLSGLEVSLQS